MSKPLAPVKEARRNPDGTVTITLWDGNAYPRDEYLALVKQRGIQQRDLRDWNPVTQSWDEPQSEEPSWM